MESKYKSHKSTVPKYNELMLNQNFWHRRIRASWNNLYIETSIHVHYIIKVQTLIRHANVFKYNLYSPHDTFMSVTISLRLFWINYTFWRLRAIKYSSYECYLHGLSSDQIHEACDWSLYNLRIYQWIVLSCMGTTCRLMICNVAIR